MMDAAATYLAQRPAFRPAPRPALILLHSSASSARQWQGLVDALQPRYRVLAVELHGHGAGPEWSGDAPQQMKRLDMPMLILKGSRTVETTRRLGELLRAALPSALHETLADMAHMGPVTHADVFNRRVAGFLDANVRTPAVPEFLHHY